jgi:hypothetical protein
MHVFKRLWATAENRRTRRPDPQQRAGRRAETRAARALQTHDASGSLDAWGALRIPDIGTGRLLEIDFVLAFGNSLAAIELKHWIGRVETQDGRLLQHGSSGGTTDHGRLLDRLDARLDSLRAFLNERDVASTEIASYLAFASPDLHVDADLDSDRHRIVVASSANTGLHTDDPADHLAGAMHRVIDDAFDTQRDDPPGTPDEQQAIRDALDAAGTWDKLHYHGGRIVTGDIDWVVGPDHRLSNRHEIAHIDLEVSRSYLDALTQPPGIEATLNNRDDNTEQTDLTLDDRVCIQPAGSQDLERVALRHLEGVTFGAPRDLTRSLDWASLDPGDRHRGRIAGIVEFGLFVDFGAPTDGLVHVSQVDHHRHTEAHELPKRFAEHQLVEVRITDVDRDAGEISLQLLS